MPDINPDSIVVDKDPDADMANADDGSNFKPDEPAASTAAAASAATAAPARNGKGQFVKGGKEAAAVEEDPADDDPVGDDPAAGDDPTGVDPAGDDPADEPTGKTVPLARFKEVINQRNDLAAKLVEAEKAHKQAQVQDRDEMKETVEKRDALYEQVEVLRADGDPKGAAKLQREIDGYNQQIADIKAGMVARQAAYRANENASYDRMLDQLEQSMPMMDPNAPEYDQRYVAEMEFQVQAYEKMGMPSTQALRRAAALIFQQDPFAPASHKQAAAAIAAPAAPAPKRTNIAKNLEAANRNAPETGHKTAQGDVAGSKSIYDLTDDELAALPDSVLARMRGDRIE